MALRKLLFYNVFVLLLAIGASFTQGGCYSLKGISIPPDVNTFYVKTFDYTASNIVPTLRVDFTEKLKNKIRNESRLIYNDEQPDISFSGNITDYSVSYVAPQAGETTALNRLEIKVKVEFVNAKNEKENWSNVFRFFQDFPANQNLLAVQDELIANITDQLVEDIFNRAFTNW